MDTEAATGSARVSLITSIRPGGRHESLGHLAFHDRFAPHVYRAEVRERSRAYLHALHDRVERKNGWQPAEAMGRQRWSPLSRRPAPDVLAPFSCSRLSRARLR